MHFYINMRGNYQMVATRRLQPKGLVRIITGIFLVCTGHFFKFLNPQSSKKTRKGNELDPENDDIDIDCIIVSLWASNQ